MKRIVKLLVVFSMFGLSMFQIPVTSFANQQESTTYQDNVQAAGTLEELKQIIDSKISLVGNQFILNDSEFVETIIVASEDNISREANVQFDGEDYFESIKNNLFEMNNNLNSGMYHITEDKGIEKNQFMSRQARPEKPYTLSTHWWGLKFQSFGPNGTVDLYTFFLNSALVELTISGALGLTPSVQVLGVIPLLQSAYDGMVANTINGEITKGTHKKGIQVDINNWVPHYSVYPNQS